MYIKKIFLLIIFAAASLTASAEQISLGGQEGWKLIYSMDTSLNGPAGAQTLSLSDSEYSPNADTEMLFHFNDVISDEGGQYTVKRNTGIRISRAEKKKGAGSAVFTGDKAFLELIPHETAIFAAGSGRLNDFSIEFWMNPARLSEGETILRWTGAADTGEILQQELLCAVTGRDLFWEVKNIFLTPELSPVTFTLRSTRSLIPKRWHHHMLRYDNETGLLEYLIDGIPEDIVYTTRSGREEQEVFYPYIGAVKATGFMIGRNYTGYLDELRITSSFAEPVLEKYSMNSGTAITDIIDLENYDSRFLDLRADASLEGKTQIYYYYRISNEYFQPGSDFPRWNQFEADTPLPPEVKGRYLQIMTEMFPDGTGVNSPRLAGLTINYTRNLPPVPPAYITGSAGNNRAVLSWQPVTDSDVAGFMIYYGDKPGMYFGSDAAEGSSPIDAGNTLSFEVNGLENGKIYYFAITSYDSAEIPHESIFSREISVRPSAITGDRQ